LVDESGDKLKCEASWVLLVSIGEE